MSCIPASRKQRPDPLFDVEKAITDYAWNVGARKSFWGKRLKDKLYQLKVNWAYLEVTHKVKSFTLRQTSGQQQQRPHPTRKGNIQDKIQSRDLCLFRTEFSNNTNEAQTFTFKTERQTKSVCSINVQKGWTIGAKLNLSFSVPTGPMAKTENVDPINITGGLSGQYEVRKTEGEQYEETLIWSVNSEVKVEPQSVSTASLMIREEECSADFVIESTIRATDAIPVMQYSRKDGRLVDILEIERHKMADIFRDVPKFYLGEDGEVKCKTSGTYHAVYGAEQIIDVQSHSLNA